VIIRPAGSARRPGRKNGGAFLEGTGWLWRIVALAAIALGAGSPVAWSCGANLRPQEPVEQVFELRVEGGQVADEMRTLRVTEGDRVRLRWTADALTVLHLHGYDIEKEVGPGRVIEFAFEAYATGRFPVEVHAQGDASHHAHDEATLVVLEVYPR
jgi:FtsP/CotA-like multicopper oxidase with cupredoxin domain